ncbi:MAG: AmmeMemoRadiSam system protein A [Desulfurivibrionaceae bacterium]
MREDNGELTKNQGKVLLALARQTIAENIGRNLPQAEKKMVENWLQDSALQQKRGTFVTLTKDENLRGCIGNITPVTSIADGVRQNAVQAAFNDPRFPPLQAEEFDEIKIEVSILTEPRQLDYQDGHEIPRKLRPEVDGVIIRSGMASSTFLPQVWEKLPDPEDFLNNLCLKAGLDPGYWKTGKPEVQTYQVQSFTE